jgi:nanoRNase/pAp phosphatase (c-di-AMP/oligoRNAs hydrolase)
MRYAVVCQSRSQADLLFHALNTFAEEISFAVESESLERHLRRQGCQVTRGELRDRELYRKLLPADLLLIALKDRRRLRGVLAAVERERGDTPVLALSVFPLSSLPIDINDYPWVHFVELSPAFSKILTADIRLSRAKIKLRQLREILRDAKSVLVLLQDDPDPDGLACGLALRTLLGRKRKTMPIGSFGRVTRPENIEMCRILDIEVVEVTSETLQQYDRVVMIDTQPPHLRHPLPRVDAVIDHHPAQTSYDARYKDVRNSYGATATILVEYLLASGTKVNERLATALLYAIRSDTLLLDRPVTTADVEAFTWLFVRANRNWIRRIERPSLPQQVLPAFAEGLKNARISDRVVFSHLGEVAREDIIPQLADFCLQVEDVDWSVVSGVYGGELIMSIRNVGFVQAAGGVVKAAFADLGAAGGHRSMAKAIIPVDKLPRTKQGVPSKKAYGDIESRLLSALRGED